jgi:hypothetical protein
MKSWQQFHKGLLCAPLKKAGPLVALRGWLDVELYAAQ